MSNVEVNNTSTFGIFHSIFDIFKYGITDGLIRMSIGMENVQDIVFDLQQALEGL